MLKKIKFDYILALTVLALIIFGIVMMASIGVPKSIDLTKPSGVAFPICGANGVDCYFLLKRHIVRLVFFAVPAFLLAFFFPFKLWRKLGVPFFFVNFLLLCMVLLLGNSFTTFATSWFVIFGTSVQPAEFAKLALIFYLALWMERKGRDIEDFHKGFIAFCFLTGVVVLPIILQPDLGGTMIFSMIAVSMYYFAGARLKHLGIGFLSMLIALMVIVPFNDYIGHRVKAYLNPSPATCEVITDTGVRRDYCWQTEQANIAIATGGFWGKGLTQGIQKSYWLPQASDDFIFAASSEELGFIRISFVVIAFFIIAYRGSLIAKNANDRFAKFTALGITVWITGQAFINIAVNTGLMPVTGVTLPFISYGGSSMVSTAIGIGVLLNISANHTSNYEKNSTNGRGKRRSRYA